MMMRNHYRIKLECNSNLGRWSRLQYFRLGKLCQMVKANTDSNPIYWEYCLWFLAPCDFRRCVEAFAGSFLSVDLRSNSKTWTKWPVWLHAWWNWSFLASSQFQFVTIFLWMRKMMQNKGFLSASPLVENNPIKSCPWRESERPLDKKTPRFTFPQQ